MGDVIALGMTHYPMLSGPDDHMADLLRSSLRDPDIPEERKNPANWPELAQREWADDGATAAAAGHRAALLSNLSRVRRELDNFNPDVLIVWGDDQYENFREEVVPSFCVLVYDDTPVEPFGVMSRLMIPNFWSLPNETTFRMQGAPEFARTLATGLLQRDVDVAYSYEKRQGIYFPHAFANTQVFLDYDNVGQKFPFPMVPIAVNCYGEHVIARHGGRAKFAEIAASTPDPPGPSPRRCMAFGRAVAQFLRETDKRVALIASASWSHAFLNDIDWHLRPDTDSDRRMYDYMVKRDFAALESITTKEIVDAGEHEMLNWFCMFGAVQELDLRLQWSDFVQTEVFNSNKVFCSFK
jgi:hypothetical protein